MANSFSDLIPQKKPKKQFSVPAQIGEGVVSVGRKALAEPLSGLAGLFSLPFVGVDTAARNIESVKDFIGGEPAETPVGSTIERAVGRVGEGALTATRSIPAAMATSGGDPEETLAQVLAERDVTPQAREEVRQQITQEGVGPFLGESTFEATGSPGLAATAEAVPTGIASLFVFGRRPAAKPTTQRPDTSRPTPVVEQNIGASVGRPTLDPPVDVTPQSIKIVENLKRGKTQKVVDDVVPDVEIVESARRLGVDLNPEHYSTNIAFQDVARALKNQPGAKLQVSEQAALTALRNNADDLIEDIGGSLDRAAVSESIRLDIANQIGSIRLKEGGLYDQVRGGVPVRVKVKTERIKSYLDEGIADLGGNKALLAKPQKDLLRMIKSAKGGTVTYGALDQVRKNIGSGYQRKGPYKDLDSATLDEVYGVVSDTQNSIADAFGVGDIYAGAKELTVKRKGLEDVSIALFGRNLANSLVPKIRQSATGLTKGDISAFNKLMDAIPAGRRSEVAASVLGELFAGGSRRGGQLGQGFVASFEALNRSPVARDLLFKHLPKAAKQRYNDIGRVLTGIVKSNQKPLSNPSGSAGPIIQAFNDASAIRKVYEVGKKVVPAEALSTSLGLPGAGTAGTVGAVLAKGKTPVLVAADDLLTSPAFTKAVQTAIDGDIAKANKIVEGSPQYKRWIKIADENSAGEIARLGFITWLTEEQ